ncbi:MAG: hypothetical protein C3L25_11900 [Candidatus Sedimenticola endophacoides]|uniref:Uncharacterized protein n=1 Tax=Candidatus Sedimenticola endophacoides TaxID=2548426 RepID=A0A6N4DYF6_9GAMM|nr:MAG: hypothetical protein C3L25_11900 [Candidatus Sedimenticola endophacoides]PUE04900.1 MAG: hypothetical protein C3L24_02360 [Candidatus Sedimenticola endophacoides]
MEIILDIECYVRITLLKQRVAGLQAPLPAAQIPSVHTSRGTLQVQLGQRRLQGVQAELFDR